ncbi:MAG: hypothetical protein LBT26_00240 [Clostridiales Family XIII bacterium]|jgi:hypothetical protein|nr:hypothetical protein [Clostridiales Family XIII bacterium]
MDNLAKNLKQDLNDLFSRNMEGFLVPDTKKQKVFISLTDGLKRAATFVGSGNTMETAFSAARSKALKQITGIESAPKWISMAFVSEEESISKDELYKEFAATKKHYYRSGLALDEDYQFAFLEQEINGSGLIKYGAETGPPTLHDHNITYFLRRRRLIDRLFVFSEKDLGPVIKFRTKSCFYDIQEKQYHDLYDGGLEKGIRVTDSLDAGALTDLAEKSGAYLKSTAMDDGRFVYGYFPVFDREIQAYNAIRHCLSVMALMEIYKLTKDESYVETIRKTYAYFMDQYYIEIDAETAVIVDKENEDEIRLGSLGLSLVAMQMYAELFGADAGITEKAVRIANTICTLQDDTGQFTHVLQYPDMSVKEKFRIVYYSGEACYGLMKLYAATKDEKYLSTVKKAFEFFIDNRYDKYYDHWLSYSVNELVQYAPEDRYFEFGLKNATNKLDFIIDRLTTWPTFLEMLNAASGMVAQIKALGKEKLLENYDMDKFGEALTARLFRQLNGVLFPEMAMYYGNPDKMLYGVFIRHHYFRVRDDDVAHHLIGYCHFVKNVLPGYKDGVARREG